MHFELTTTGAVEESIQTLREFLKTYQAAHPAIAFDYRDLDWNVAWPELVRTAIARTGAHISEVGAPWVADFVAMNSLRRFSPAEVDAVGGAGAFFPAPWANVVISPSSLTPPSSTNPPAFQAASSTNPPSFPNPQSSTNPQSFPNPPSAPGVYGLPGRVDVRLIYYWKDMLEQAGVDPAAAFTTPADVERTLATLRASGRQPACANPWVYETHATRNWVYNMASWIWAHGGSFTDEIGLPVFDHPQAVQGMAAYFRLHRYLAPTPGGESIEQVFSERRTAVMLAATHYHVHLLHQEDPWLGPQGARDMLPRLGAAQLPGPAFVGGTSFVIWQHTSPKTTRTAVDLLTRLLNSAHMPEYCYGTHMLPSRLDGFRHPEIAADPFLPVLRASLETGRTHKSSRLWMPIADRLAVTCREIFLELRQNPHLDVLPIVERHTHALVQRLRQSFSAAA